jgi:hypothetical protein
LHILLEIRNPENPLANKESPFPSIVEGNDTNHHRESGGICARPKFPESGRTLPPW